MANQIGLKLLTRPGDEVIVGAEAHIVGTIRRVLRQLRRAVHGRRTGWHIRRSSLQERLKPAGHWCFHRQRWWPSKTRIIAGAGWFSRKRTSSPSARQPVRWASPLIWMGRAVQWAVAGSRSLAELAGPFDVVSVALSKGMGCPVGSLVAGTAEAMRSAVRARRMLGGAMRQSGILAAAGLHALDQGMAHLAEDHANARAIAELVAQTEAEIDMATVQTNIVIFRLPGHLPDAETVVRRAKEQGVLVLAFAPRTVRATTHLNVSAAQCRRAGEILASASQRTSRRLKAATAFSSEHVHARK